jgi:hypothetical protein
VKKSCFPSHQHHNDPLARGHEDFPGIIISISISIIARSFTAALPNTSAAYHNSYLEGCNTICLTSQFTMPKDTPDSTEFDLLISLDQHFLVVRIANLTGFPAIDFGLSRIFNHRLSSYSIHKNCSTHVNEDC